MYIAANKHCATYFIFFCFQHYCLQNIMTQKRFPEYDHHHSKEDSNKRIRREQQCSVQFPLNLFRFGMQYDTCIHLYFSYHICYI